MLVGDAKVTTNYTFQKYTFNFSADTGANEYTATVAEAVTALWKNGSYSYTLFVDTATTSYTIETGTVAISLRGDLITSTDDLRTHAAKVLASIETLLEGKALSDVQNYSIQGRSLTKMSIPELTKLYEFYRERVLRETNKKWKVKHRLS